MEKMKIDTLVFDFNGTIINDLDLCLDILNKMLTLTNHKNVTKDEYLSIFTFPIIDYYVKAGFDLKPGGKDDFHSLAVIFDKSYRSQYMNCPIFSDVIPTLKKYYSKKKMILLSATKQEELDKQIASFGLTSYFDDVIGIKDIYAKSKLEEARLYFSTHPFNPSSTLFIGDTIHDYQVGKQLNSKTCLVSRGHQSTSVLKTEKSNLLLSDLASLDQYID